MLIGRLVILPPELELAPLIYIRLIPVVYGVLYEQPIAKIAALERPVVQLKFKSERDKMCEDRFEKSTWATGGGVLIGIGVGFFFLAKSVLFFIGCIMAGLGIGLVMTAFMSKVK
jgi:hypothetical protein